MMIVSVSTRAWPGDRARNACLDPSRAVPSPSASTSASPSYVYGVTGMATGISNPPLGQLEASAEHIKRLQDLQTTFGLWGNRLLRRQGEERIRAKLGAADATAELIELRKAKAVCTVYD